MFLNINLIVPAYVVVKVQAIPAPAGDTDQGQPTPGPLKVLFQINFWLRGKLLAVTKRCVNTGIKDTQSSLISHIPICPDKIKASWFNVRMNCDEAVGPYTPVQCDKTLGKYGIVPFSSWGTAPPKVTKLWNSSKCSIQLCYIWTIKYGVVLFGSYGSFARQF
ncbi:hypothetical protein BASA83_012301 [Batrachochytrium salamandrivorans]|nr:hypothetical protein BASA83_012301 [Batrachochytrium salamandrivorans]